MEDEARQELSSIRQDGLDELRATLWVASLIYLADACAAVGDEALAALLYPELAPLAGGNVVIGHGVACYGAADRYLGLLAATLRDHDRAVEHFEQALAVNRDMGATTWVAHTLYAFGRTLRIRGASDDAVQASELLSEAATIAERIGMPVLLARAHALGARIEHTRKPPDDLSWRELDILRLVAVGRSNREIGEELCISGHTVANHVRSILRKTGAANRTEAAGYAYRHALVDGADTR
jgi:DNA-binding CsgD family transcriptional regulator